MHRVERLSIREIHRRTGLHRETIRRALSGDRPPRYRRCKAPPSKLDPFKEEIERLLRSDPRIPNTRIRELIAELGYQGGKSILDDHLREVRPRFAPKRTYQRTAKARRRVKGFLRKAQEQGPDVVIRGFHCVAIQAGVACRRGSKRIHFHGNTE
jgi:hypothetical protein